MSFQARADVVEYLGNEELLHVNAAGQDVVAIVNSSHRVRPGDIVDLVIPLAKVHFFDAETQASMGAVGAPAPTVTTGSNRRPAPRPADVARRGRQVAGAAAAATSPVGSPTSAPLAAAGAAGRGRGSRSRGAKEAHLNDPLGSREPTAPEDDSGADLVERVVESRVIHHGHYLTFRVDTVELPDGRRSTRDIAGHPGAVAVVALDAEDRVALVRQWRLPAEGTLLEIPAGGLDVRTGRRPRRTRTSPRRANSRRRPDCGPRLGANSGRSTPRPGFTDELMHLYLATDLDGRPSRRPPGSRRG